MDLVNQIIGSVWKETVAVIHSARSQSSIGRDVEPVIGWAHHRHEKRRHAIDIGDPIARDAIDLAEPFGTHGSGVHQFFRGMVRVAKCISGRTQIINPSPDLEVEISWRFRVDGSQSGMITFVPSWEAEFMIASITRCVAWERSPQLG